jgi:hypothetical protein
LFDTTSEVASIEAPADDAATEKPAADPFGATDVTPK